MLTANEKKVLKFLMASLSYNSINEVARKCGITPNGAYKILKKLEKTGVVHFKEVGNIKAYMINFENQATLSYLEIALTDERANEPKIRVRIRDFEEIKKLCRAAVIFGSYITDKKNPRDVDVLFIFDKNRQNSYRRQLEKVRNIIPYKLHDVIQTPEDLTMNIKEQDELIMNVITSGVVLWGHDVIARSVKNAHIK